MAVLSVALGRYRKAISAFFAGALAWGGTVVASKPTGVTAAEWLALGGVVFTTLVVAWSAANDPPTPLPPLGGIDLQHALDSTAK